MKKVVMYLTVAFLIIFFGYSITFISKYSNYTYSYKMYYIDQKTNFWYGNDGLEIKYNVAFDYTNMEDRHSDSYYEGLQYLGKNFFKNRTYIINIDEIYVNDDCSLFYQIKEENINKKYVIKITIEDIDDNSIDFKLNNLLCEYTKDGNLYTIEVKENASKNELTINSNKRAQLMNLIFVEIE